jgi:hypothetical protein
VGQGGAQLTLQADVAGVGPVTGGGAANSENSAAKRDDEPGDAGFLAALDDRRPVTGPLHARASGFLIEVGHHAKRDYSLQFLFRQMSERT